MASEIDISRGTEQAVSNSERAFNVHQTRPINEMEEKYSRQEETGVPCQITL
jgi:hypothetical protein